MEAKGIRIKKLQLCCPLLPDTLQTATLLWQDPERLEFGPVLVMVQRDPIVAAQLLQMANAAYYSRKRTISSLEQVVVMLGPLTVTGIVLGMNLLRPRATLRGQAAHYLTRLVRHSLAAGFLTRYLYERAVGDKHCSGIGFTAGLLHDFGKIILIYNAPHKTVTAYGPRPEQACPPHVEARQREQSLFGYTHTQAGAYAAGELCFPDTLRDVIQLHHDPAAADSRLRRLTSAANLAAKAMGYAFHDVLDWNACLTNAIWPLLLRADFPQYRYASTLIEQIETQHASLQAFLRLHHLADRLSRSKISC